jgi:hypothetical protein
MVSTSFINRLSQAVDRIESQRQPRPWKVVTVPRRPRYETSFWRARHPQMRGPPKRRTTTGGLGLLFLFLTVGTPPAERSGRIGRKTGSDRITKRRGSGDRQARARGQHSRDGRSGVLGTFSIGGAQG